MVEVSEGKMGWWQIQIQRTNVGISIRDITDCASVEFGALPSVCLPHSHTYTFHA